MTAALGSGTPSPSPLKHVQFGKLDRTYPVDYHNHTKWTDGTASADEMAQAASKAGIREFLFSEHVRSTSTYFPEFAKTIRALAVDGLTIYLGVEAKVLDMRGTLDAPADIESLCDAIIGSVHSPPNDDGTSGSWKEYTPSQALEKELQLALSIVTHSRAHIIGHPLGMVITKFGLQPREELLAIARACALSGKAFELNPRYSLDPNTMIEIVTEAGCKVNIGSDAHFTDAVGSSWKKFVLGSEPMARRSAS